MIKVFNFSDNLPNYPYPHLFHNTQKKRIKKITLVHKLLIWFDYSFRPLSFFPL